VGKKKIAVVKGIECILDCLAGFGLLGRRGKQEPVAHEDREGSLFWLRVGSPRNSGFNKTGLHATSPV
jgi:hypothetical protein